MIPNDIEADALAAGGLVVILDHAPLMEEASSLIGSGCTKLLFPYASESLVAESGADLALARDALEAAGVQFGVRWPGGVS